jgi:hypothetical protein
MTSVLSRKGITFNACGGLRTPSLCSGPSQWAAVRTLGLRAATRSAGPNTIRHQGRWHTLGQGLRFRPKLLASFGRGAPRYPAAMQEAARLGLCAAPGRIASFPGMRYNSAAHADARASAMLCKGHRARAGGCER